MQASVVEVSGALGVMDFIAARNLRLDSLMTGDSVQHPGAIHHARSHQVGHTFLAALNFTFDEHQAGGHDGAALLVEIARP